MSKELVCPFCNKKLEPIGTSGQFQCGTWGCDASFNFIATRDVWEYIDRIRKALEIAKDTIRHTDWFFDGDYNVDAKTMHNEIKCAIKGITALEQKD